MATTFAVVVALMMLVFSLHVAANLLCFLGIVGWIAALTLWLFLFSLSASNSLFNPVEFIPQ